ncbi:P pilus assembly protein, pilin FimA [Cedecea davisae]|uniref:Fimbrial protein n=1 Tax=Cedecea davisae DSM 4568 TaxID=566551 RepID=S3JJ26_9ENTR|nr:hypothetical protein [Cedecea davisae]EPF20127.1 hypothetical protein HMPREF0201_00727 [Cedecea davisae DSM 4568]SUX36245.1 P pilus assembly protein, pilin FimA [Cedecea davisae]
MGKKMKQEMKARCQQGIRRIVLLGALGPLFAAPAALAAESATTTITIKGTVRASCSIGLKNSSVTLPPVDLVENQKPGETIPDVTPTKIEVTGKCTGAEKIKYSLKAVSGVDGSCLAPAEGKVIQMCLYNGEKKLDFTGGTVPTIENQKNGELTLDIKPAYGTAPKTGEYSASLSIKVEPM